MIDIIYFRLDFVRLDWLQSTAIFFTSSLGSEDRKKITSASERNVISSRFWAIPFEPGVNQNGKKHSQVTG